MSLDPLELDRVIGTNIVPEVEGTLDSSRGDVNGVKGLERAEGVGVNADCLVFEFISDAVFAGQDDCLDLGLEDCVEVPEPFRFRPNLLVPVVHHKACTSAAFVVRPVCKYVPVSAEFRFFSKQEWDLKVPFEVFDIGKLFHY